MRDIIFLFGAGASYGAGGILPERPPLGFQLYGELAKLYPNSWGVLSRRFGTRFDQSFELGMQEIYDHYSQIIPQLMRELSLYFIQFRPINKGSLYCRLVDFLKHRNMMSSVIFSTLNYECVLEFSLLNQNIGISYFDDSEDATNIPVWKLHGSCNMFVEGISVTSGVLFGKGVTFEGGLVGYLDASKVIEINLLNYGLYPAMCLFMLGKPIHLSPSVVKNIQGLWQDRILRSKAIFCVGVNPLPADEHIWDPLSRTQGKLYFIGDERSFGEWTEKYRTGPTEYIAPYFHAGMKQLERILLEYVS